MTRCGNACEPHRDRCNHTLNGERNRFTTQLRSVRPDPFHVRSCIADGWVFLDPASTVVVGRPGAGHAGVHGDRLLGALRGSFFVLRLSSVVFVLRVSFVFHFPLSFIPHLRTHPSLIAQAHRRSCNSPRSAFAMFLVFRIILFHPSPPRPSFMCLSIFTS